MDRITLDLDGVAEVRITTRRRGIVARAVEGDAGTLAGDGLDAIRVARDGDRLEIAEPRRDDDEEAGGTLELSLPAARSWELSADSASGAVLDRRHGWDGAGPYGERSGHPCRTSRELRTCAAPTGRSPPNGLPGS